GEWGVGGGGTGGPPLCSVLRRVRHTRPSATAGSGGIDIDLTTTVPARRRVFHRRADKGDGMESTLPPPVVWTEDEFLRAFSISRETLLAWIAQGLPVLRCADDTFRITSSALDAFVLGRKVETPYFTVDEAAKYIKRTRQAVYALVKRHRLKPCNGGARRLPFRQQRLRN